MTNGPAIDPPPPPEVKEMEPLQWPLLPSERPEHVEPWQLGRLELWKGSEI